MCSRCLFFILLAVVGPGTAAKSLSAQSSGASGSIQGSFGKRYDDDVYGLNTSDRRMSTLVLSGDGRWSLGENTFFLRLFSGHFVDDRSRLTGHEHLMYAEWTSRVSLAAIAGRRDRPGVVRDFFLASQINRGSTGFRANLIGAGIKLRGPLGLATINSLYYRHAPGEKDGLKYRTSWAMPIAVGAIPLSFEGSEDVVTGGARGTDINGMPALMVDVGALAHGVPGVLHAGVEWFHHWTRTTWTDVPQLTVRWTF